MKPVIESHRRTVCIFLIGQSLSSAGNTFTQVAVFWTALSLSGTAISLGALGGAWTFAMAVSSLLSGVIVDRLSRRSLIIVLHLILGAVSLGVYALSAREILHIWHLWVFLVAEGILGSPAGLASHSLIPDLVGKERLTRINGLLGSWGSVDNLIEAAASGVVLGIWGPAPLFLFHASTYFIGAATAWSLPAWSAAAPKQPERWNPLADLRLTIRFTLKERLLRRFIPLNLLSNLAFAPIFFMGPLVAAAVGAGSEGYGFFQSLMIGGLLAGSLLASSIGTRWPKVPMWIGGSVLYSLGFLALGLRLSPMLAYGVFFLLGLGWTGGRTYAGTLVQQTLPSAHRGRILGITGFAGGVFQPLALAVAMTLVDRASLGVVLVGLSLLMLAVSGLQLLLLPIRERDWVLSEPEGEPPSD
ncbi:MFS transporter [Candidatus Bipolaricaulota bacterium]|nr:MFS transporter [Candidatus Bipolaricaulota bacterium]